MRTAVFDAAVCGFLVLAAGALRADPCLVAYPDAPCVYQYDPAEYCTVDPGDCVVSTPTPTGHNYSDTKSIAIDWRGCYGVHIWAFADANHDGKREGGECFTAFSQDIQIPAHDKTWGTIKEIFR